MNIKKYFLLLTKMKYLKGALKKTEAEIESIENPFGDYYVIKLKPQAELTWKPGEHGIFKLVDKNIKGKDYRIFSVASTPEEGSILLGTRISSEPSSYKKELISMKQGEKIKVTGPFGWFLVKDDVSPMVLFASGVGITPIRGLLKQLENDQSRPIEIVYVSNEYYLFEEEIEEIRSKNPKIKLYKVKTPRGAQERLVKLAKKYKNNAYYYISGAPAVLQSISKLLKKSGIKKVIHDEFDGYK